MKFPSALLPVGKKAQIMDFNALRAKAANAGAKGEAVTVNMRSLIDKVLARYSSEW